MSTGAEDNNTNPMGDFFEMLFEKVLDRVLDRRNSLFPKVDQDTALMIAQINAKPHITIAEAALLLGCSASHLYTKITAARKDKTKHPVPFLDLDGVYVLPREELLAWAQIEKERVVQKRKRKQ